MHLANFPTTAGVRRTATTPDSDCVWTTAFPFDKIKVDKSFIGNLMKDDKSLAIVTLGRGLDISIIAEGVETCE